MEHGFWIGERTLVQRLLSAAIGGGPERVPHVIWRRLNLLWIVFYALLGVLNLLVAYQPASAPGWSSRFSASPALRSCSWRRRCFG